MYRSCLLIIVLLLSGCSNMLFVPYKPFPLTPDGANLSYEDQFITTEDGLELHGWKIHAEKKTAGNILFFHGNGDNVSTQFLLRSWSMPDGLDLLLMVLTGLTSALGFMCSSNAYQRQPASLISPFEYVMIIWVILLSYLVWSELPDAMTLLGAGLIVASGIYVIRREAQIEARSRAYSGLTRR